MRLVGKRIGMVIAPQQFHDEELFVPRDMFTERGAELIIASSKTGQCRGSQGGVATAMTLLQQLRPERLDARLLRGRHATCWPDPDAQDALLRGGATLRCYAVVTDGSIVTAVGPRFAEQWAAEVASLLIAN